jgi:hypothetical protein
MYRIVRYLMPFAAAAMLAGCAIKESAEDASLQVGKFHAALDAGQWQSVWTGADPALRESSDKATFGKLLEAIHRKLGDVKESKQVGVNVNAGTGGTFVTVTMQTTFAKGAGTEEFVYRKRGEKDLTLVRYNIASQDMMLN